MENQKLNWNTIKPLNNGTYICDLGAEGVCYGWFDGNDWFKLWGSNYSASDKILIYGWIKIPEYVETEINQINKQ